MVDATSAIEHLTFLDDGAQLFRQALTSGQLRQLEAILSHLPPDHAGMRLRGVEGLAAFLAADGPIGSCAASVLGEASRPVRTILFDKTAATNWALGWHQDRTIAVKQRVAVAGFETWSVKSGMQHVEPPFALLSGMVTLRVHIDPVPASNAAATDRARIAQARTDSRGEREGCRPALRHGRVPG